MSFENLKEVFTTGNYPFVRRDKAVRAKVLGGSEDTVLIETAYPGSDPVKRSVTREYFENNYWEGVT